MKQVIELLNKAYIDMTKTAKLADTIYARSTSVQTGTQVFKDTQKKLVDCMQKLDTCISVLGYMIKFRKVKSTNDDITLDDAKLCQQESAKCLYDILDTMKAMKALVPSKKKGRLGM